MTAPREHRGSVAKQIAERIDDGDLIHDDQSVIAFCAVLLGPVYGRRVGLNPYAEHYLQTRPLVERATPHRQGVAT